MGGIRIFVRGGGGDGREKEGIGGSGSVTGDTRLTGDGDVASKGDRELMGEFNVSEPVKGGFTISGGIMSTDGGKSGGNTEVDGSDGDGIETGGGDPIGDDKGGGFVSFSGRGGGGGKVGAGAGEAICLKLQETGHSLDSLYITSVYLAMVEVGIREMR